MTRETPGAGALYRKELLVIDAERLKPYLVHDDYFLRKAAVEYFHDYWAPDSDIIPLVLHASRRWGAAESISLLSKCYRFRLSETGLTQLLDYLPQVSDRMALDHLNRVLSQAPADLAAAARPTLRATANVFPETVTRLERRIQLAERSPEDLWQELQDFARRSEDKRYVGEIDHDYADDLVSALAPHSVPDTPTLCHLLATLGEAGGWLEIFLVDLAGSRRVPEAIPALVDFLAIDADYLLQRTNEALAKINDAEAIRLIRERYVQWPWAARLFAVEPLGDIKRPETEAAVLELLPHEKGLDLQTTLCFDLCKLFSEPGVEVVLRQIRTGYDASMVELKDELLPVADILGVRLPQAEAWRKERQDRERQFRQRLSEMDEWVNQSKAQPKPSPAAARHLPPPVAPALVNPRPAEGSRGRVGRNDPCPCGSGKKFKKCCGAR
jgi:hypothetical protein